FSEHNGTTRLHDLADAVIGGLEGVQYAKCPARANRRLDLGCAKRNLSSLAGKPQRAQSGAGQQAVHQIAKIGGGGHVLLERTAEQLPPRGLFDVTAFSSDPAAAPWQVAPQIR